MPTLEKKKAIVEEITDKLESSLAIYVTNYSGLSVPEINELRSKFAEDGLTYRVYKNTLIKRAMEEVGGYDDLYDHLHNQNAFAFAEEELAKPAKILKKFNEEHVKPEFKAALIDGGYYGPDQLEKLAAMKSKEEVIGDIVSLLQAPISNVVSALQAQGENMASAVKTIAENADELGTAEETDAAEDSEEEEESAAEDESASAEETEKATEEESAESTEEAEAETDDETEEGTAEEADDETAEEETAEEDEEAGEADGEEGEEDEEKEDEGDEDDEETEDKDK